jgi:hypothetical protein
LNNGITFFELKLYFTNSADNLNIDKPAAFIDVRLYLNKFNTVLSEIDFIDSNFGSFGIINKNNKDILYLHCILGFRVKVPSTRALRKKIESVIIGLNFDFYELCYLDSYTEVMRTMRDITENFSTEREYNIAFSCTFSNLFFEIHALFNSCIDGCFDYVSQKTKFIFFGYSPFTGDQYVPLGKYSNFKV